MDASYLRAKARQSLAGNYWMAVLVAYIAVLLGGLITNSAGSIRFEFNFDSSDLSALQEDIAFLPPSVQEFFQNIPPFVFVILGTIVAFAGAISIGLFVIGGVIQLGYAKYLLKQYDRQECGVKDLFSMFHVFGKGFLQSFLRSLYIILWSLLFVIPGIVKIYSYAMTPFILAENPHMTANEAITASKELMQGHKWELFWLELTFIGWQLLSALTLGIGSYFLNPYTNAAHAAFYRDLVPAGGVQSEPIINEPFTAE